MFVAGDLVLGFFDNGDSGEGGSAADFMMVGDGVISAVCGWRWCLMVVGAVICSVCTIGGAVSFSGVGCQRADVDLFVFVFGGRTKIHVFNPCPAE